MNTYAANETWEKDTGVRKVIPIYRNEAEFKATKGCHFPKNFRKNVLFMDATDFEERLKVELKGIVCKLFHLLEHMFFPNKVNEIILIIFPRI